MWQGNALVLNIPIWFWLPLLAGAVALFVTKLTKEI